MPKQNVKLTFILSAIILICASLVLFLRTENEDEKFISYTVDPKKQLTRLYWKDEHNTPFKSIANLKQWLEKNNKQLLFAMNGGMYKDDNSPLGLFIENGKTITKVNRYNGKGNFYLKPNGVFYITKENKAFITSTEKFTDNGRINYATQSGPMLVVDGKINEAFKKGSVNLNIRNGVGILPDNQILFAMSKQEINLYDFAEYFKNKGCKNALYLDGFVSRVYLPAKKWMQTDGNFGVIIGVTDLNLSSNKKY